MCLPSVSIIVPVLNEAENIADCLQSLLRQNYPRDLYEIIVVDNGSTDDSVKISRCFADKVYIRRDVKVGAVRNFGVKQAKGEVVAFIDGDCLANENWLLASSTFLGKGNVGAVGGGCLLRERPSWVERGWKLNLSRETRKVKALLGGSFILKKALFDKLNGFSETVNAGEDTKLSMDIVSLGLEIWYLKECYVVHLGYPVTLGGFFRREFWHASSYLKSNNGFKDRVFITVILFLLSVVSLIMYFLTNHDFTLFGSVFIVICPVAFFIHQLKSQGLKGVPLLSIFYALVLSFVYYFGRGSGLVKSIFD